MEGKLLSLASACKIAGVTPPTMKNWVPKIEGAHRDQNGQYKIPEHSLRVYLLGKSAPKVHGASGKDMGPTEGSITAPNFIDLLHAQISEKDNIINELKADNRSLKTDLKDSQAEIRKLEAELRAHLSGTSLVGTVSRWIKGR